MALALFGLLPVLSLRSAAQQAPVRRIVLVLDGSLSMIVRDAPPAGDGTPGGPTRFDVAVRDLQAALDHLAARRGRWEFRILAFGAGAAADGAMWSYPAAPSRFAQPGELDAATAALDQLRAAGPAGPSALRLALERALDERPTRILLYTDGMPLATAADNVPAAQVEVLDALHGPNGANGGGGGDATTRVPIDVVGVGAGVARAHDFLRTLAQDSGGYFVVTE